jgi:hypothetical protein
MKRASERPKVLRAAALLALVFALAACNPVENDSQSASLVVVESLKGVDAQGNDADFLASDVVLINADSGSRSWRADSAVATLSVRSLDPQPILGTSQYYDVQMTRYVVTYFRSDGKNVPGRDVPYSFDGMMSLTIPVGSTGSVAFVLVREVAKQELPLLGLYQANPGDVLNMTAKIEFYGHDLANRTVKATGYIPVYFANYADL